VQYISSIRRLRYGLCSNFLANLDTTDAKNTNNTTNNNNAENSNNTNNNNASDSNENAMNVSSEPKPFQPPRVRLWVSKGSIKFPALPTSSQANTESVPVIMVGPGTGR
jgi:hypothetical protein